MGGKVVILLPSKAQFGREIALCSSVTFPVLPMVTIPCRPGSFAVLDEMPQIFQLPYSC